MTSRKPDEWMPLDVRKYLGDTMHLSRDQHGAYLLLIMAYWMRGGPLNDNDAELASIAKASLSDWRRLRPIIASFFQIENGKWVQKRAEEELARARKFIERKSEAGRKGAENRWRTNGVPNGKRDGTAMAQPLADGMANRCLEDAPVPLPSTSKQEESILPVSTGPKKPRNSYPERFEKFWAEYPTDSNMSKKDAVKAWKKLTPEQQESAIKSIPAFRRYCAENKDWYRVIYADRYLSKEKFEGHLTGQQQATGAPANLEELQRLEDEARQQREASNVH